MKKLLLVFAIAVFIFTTYSANPIVDTNLCASNENIVISFRMANSARRLSVLVAKDDSYIVYRYGTQNNVELEYPADKRNAWNMFILNYSMYAGGGGHSLHFRNSGFEYEVFDIQSTSPGPDGLRLPNHYVGVEVTNLSTNRTTRLEGIPEGMIGNLYSLENHRRIRLNQSF